MRFIRKVNKVVIVLYLARAFFWGTAGAMIAINYDQVEVERIISCVAY